MEPTFLRVSQLKARATPRRYCWLPNALSTLRIGLAAALLPVALVHQRPLFLLLLTLAFLTDALDGFLARWLGVTSDLGRRLDSWGDHVLVLALLPGLFLLWPAFLRREAIWLALAVCAYFGPVAWSLVRWRRIPGLHTWASKALAVAGAAALLLALAGGTPVPFRVACALQVAAALEELAILRLLPGYSGSMPSYAHARRLVRR